MSSVILRDKTSYVSIKLTFLSSFRFGDVSTDAESTARKLISVTSELESTGAQVLCSVPVQASNRLFPVSQLTQKLHMHAVEVSPIIR